MSHRDSKSLDDTIPLEKDAPVMGSSGSNTFSLCSDLSDSIKSNSRDSSVEIVYEIINITDSESDNGEDQEDHEDKCRKDTGQKS